MVYDGSDEILLRVRIFFSDFQVEVRFGTHG